MKGDGCWGPGAERHQESGCADGTGSTPKDPAGAGCGCWSPSIPKHLPNSMRVRRLACEGGRGGGRGPVSVGLLGAEGARPGSRPPGPLSLVSTQLSAWSCPSPPQRWQADADLHRACGPLNEGWPLLVIKISEETLKRKPLGQGLRGPRLLSRAKAQDSPPGSGRLPAGPRINTPGPTLPRELRGWGGRHSQQRPRGGRRGQGSGPGSRGHACPAAGTPWAAWAAGHLQGGF